MTLTYLVDLLLRLLGISQTISALTVGVQAAVADQSQQENGFRVRVLVGPEEPIG